eukprot:jgi/Tetstr1/422510/TSEL_001272.t1
MAVEDRESSVLDAARCAACVAVLIYHVTMAALIPVTIGRSEAYAAFRGSVALKAGNAGSAGVDMFFVLCALLATRSLMRRLEAAKGPWEQLKVVVRYWKERAWRLLPLSWACLALSTLVTYIYLDCETSVAVVHDGLPEGGILMSSCRSELPSTAPVDSEQWAALSMSWFNNFHGVHSLLPNLLAYSNNLGLESFMTFTWSLSLQLQFFALLPVILASLLPRVPGFRRRVAAAAAASMLYCMMHRSELVEQGIAFPFPMFGTSHGAATDPSEEAAYWTMYFSSASRAGEFGAGALLAVSHDIYTRQARPHASQQWMLATWLGVAALAVVLPAMLISPISENPTTDKYSQWFQQLCFNVFFTCPVSAFAWGLLVLLAIEQAGLVGWALAWAAQRLSWATKPIARLSYAIFHVQAWTILATWRFAMPAMGLKQDDVLSGGLGAGLYLSVVLSTTYVAAVSMHKALVCPFYVPAWSKASVHGRVKHKAS